MEQEPATWQGRIESLSHDGVGVGTQLLEADGKTLRRPVFVPMTVPGDIVEAAITERKRKYAFASLSRVVTPSKERVAPRCAHFAHTGTCSLQHVSYPEQLRQKAAQVAFLLARKGIALPHPIETLPSREREHYRWRARAAMRFSPKETVAGFRKPKSREIVRVGSCLLVHERICETLALLNASPPTQADAETEVTMVVGDKGKVGLLVQLDGLEDRARGELRRFFEDLYARNRKLIGNVSFTLEGRTRSHGQVQEHFAYETHGLRFSFLPETFFQANVATNELLIDTCLRLLFSDGEGSDDTVLDLYAGIGNLSLPIARRCARVVAVEGSAESVRVGVANALSNGVENVTFVQRPVERYLQEYARRRAHRKEDGEYPLTQRVVLDPPRTGLTPAVVQELLEIDAQRLLYVSCDPVSLANDLAALSEEYALADIACIDMFPDTPHVETVALLERKA